LMISRTVNVDKSSSACGGAASARDIATAR
jgi:hypothetical protein